MPDTVTLRERLAAAGADLPPELVDVIIATAGPLLTALGDLATLELGGAEPFAPSLRLPADAPHGEAH